MNRALLNPFEASDLPRTIKDYLEHEKAICMRFNRHGNILATGTASGHIVLWDFDTRTVATVLGDHRVPGNPVSDKLRFDARLRKIVSLTFLAPGNGSAVVVAYAAGILRVFHTLSKRILCHVEFDVGLHQVEAHPKLEEAIVIVPVEGLPFLLNLRRGQYECAVTRLHGIRDPSQILSARALTKSFNSESSSNTDNKGSGECDDGDDIGIKPPPPPKTAYGNRKISALPPPSDHLPLSLLCAFDDFENENGGHVVLKELSSQPSGKRRQFFCTAFTRHQNRVLRAGPSGLLRVFALNVARDNCLTASCIATIALPGRAAVRSLTLSRRDRVLINSYDRCMRLYRMEDIEATNVPTDDTGDVVMVCGRSAHPSVFPMMTFSEIVNRSQCRTSCFSSDGDFVVGGVEGPQHRIHVWRIDDGQIDVTLEGPKEGVAQLLIHPLRPVLVSLGTAGGGLYIWDKEVSENWSAFSTQFSELEANEEYREREDEFDLADANGGSRIKSTGTNEDVDVDVDGDFKNGWFNSDSEDEDSFFYIPATPIPDKLEGGICLLSDIVLSRREEELVEAAREGNGSEELMDLGHEARRRRPSSVSVPKSSPKRPRCSPEESSASSAVAVRLPHANGDSGHGNTVMIVDKDSSAAYGRNRRKKSFHRRRSDNNHDESVSGGVSDNDGGSDKESDDNEGNGTSVRSNGHGPGNSDDESNDDYHDANGHVTDHDKSLPSHHANVDNQGVKTTPNRTNSSVDGIVEECVLDSGG